MFMPNWGMIRTGECFEALVHALVFADDHEARLMDRPGKDKAVDALSGDGETVYQAKFYSNLTMDYVVSIARNEMVKIKRLIENADATWVKVKGWVLYINVSQNTWDVEKWNAFSIEFKSETGVDAYCYGLANINQQLGTHPEIERLFFHGRNRCLLYAKETYRKLEQHSYKASFHKTKFTGRDADLSRLTTILNASDKRLVVVSGPSEVGRTRFMFEAMITLACENNRTYWGLIDSMEHSSQWFDGIPLGQDAIVFVDDCDSEQRLKLLLDQMYGSGLEGVRYVISCADASLCNINHILRRIDSKELVQLAPLSSDLLIELINGYENLSLRPDTVGAICNFSSGYPGWAVLCIAANAYHDPSVMIMAGDVISRLLDGISDGLRDKARVFLRWLALWGEVDFADHSANDIIRFLSSHGVGVALVDDLKRELADKGLIRRIPIGGDLCRIISKIVRHQILLEWLADSSDGKTVKVTVQGRELLESLIRGQIPFPQNALASLSSISIAHLPGKHTDTFIGPVMDSIMTWLKARSPLTALDEDCALGIVENIGCSDPLRAIEICRFIWENEGVDTSVDSGAYGKWDVGHAQVCARVPTVILSIAEYLDDKEYAKIYTEFLLIVWESGDERKIKYERQESPDFVIRRLVTSSRQDNPFPCAIFTHLKERKATLLDSTKLMAMAEWLFTIRLSRTFSLTSRKIIFERATVTNGTEMWHYREVLREWLFDTVGSTDDISKRCRCWRLLEREHSMLTAAISDLDRRELKQEDVVCFNDTLLADLHRVQSFISRHDADITVDELSAIRGIWGMHLLGDVSCARDDVKAVAKSCEEVYRGKIAYNLQDIYCNDYGSERTVAAMKEIVAKFLAPPDGVFFEQFFASASRFLKASQGNDENDFGRTEEIVIGMHVSPTFDYMPGDGTLLDVFVCGVYADFLGKGELERKFVVALTRFAIKKSKSADRDMTSYKELWNKIFSLVGNVEAKKNLAGRVFDRCNSNATGCLCRWELDKLLNLGLEDADKANIIPAYYNHDAERVIQEMQKLLEGAHGDQNERRGLWEVMLFRLYVASFQKVVSVDERLLEWLLDMVIDRKINERTLYSHHFETLLTQAKYRYPIKRLQELLEAGVSLERDFNVSDCFAINGDEDTFMVLCNWVLEDGKDLFMRKYTLPLYLVKLDAGLVLVKKFVNMKALECRGDAMRLRRLANFAGCFDNTFPAWRELALSICDAATSVSEVDRATIYAGLNPPFYTWGGYVGEISPDIINRMERAKEKLKEESPNSSLRGYWEFELSMATAEFNREEAEIARESDD